MGATFQFGSTEQRNRNLLFFTILVAILGCGSVDGQAQSLKQFRSIDAVPDAGGKIEVVDAEGKVRIAHLDSLEVLNEIYSGDQKTPPPFLTVKPGETLRTTVESHATVTLGEFGSVRLRPGTEVQLPKPEDAESAESSLRLIRGNVLVDINDKRKEKDKEFRLETPKVVLAVRGTRFKSEVNEDGSEATGVFEGAIQAIRELDGKKQAATIKAGKILEIESGEDGRISMRPMKIQELRQRDEFDFERLWQTKPMDALRRTSAWKREIAYGDIEADIARNGPLPIEPFQNPSLGIGIQIKPFVLTEGNRRIDLTTRLPRSRNSQPIFAEFFIQSTFKPDGHSLPAGNYVGYREFRKKIISLEEIDGWSRVLLSMDFGSLEEIEARFGKVTREGIEASDGQVAMQFWHQVSEPGTHYIRIIPGRMLVRTKE